MLIVVLRFPYVCILKHNSKSQTSVAYVVSSRYKMLAMQSVDADGRTRTCVLRVELLKYVTVGVIMLTYLCVFSVVGQS